MIEKVKEIATQAGEAICEIYSRTSFTTIYKPDASPLTEADLLAQNIIKEGLSKNFDIPILSEEEYIEFKDRKNWETFWLVDPLDGTRDFIDRNDEFTVNIALIDKGHPVMGVIYTPVFKDIYWAEKDNGAFKNAKLIKNERTNTSDFIALESRHHTQKDNQSFYSANNITNVVKCGSSLKFCKLAEGLADVYARFGKTSEWDIGAAHIILIESGCYLMPMTSQEEITYNKEDIINPSFIASRNDLQWA